MSKKVKFIALTLPVPLMLAVLGLYLSVTYVPSWYQPQKVLPGDQQAVRDELTELTRVFNNNMQRPKPFVFTLTQEQINRLIANPEVIDPKLKDLIPEDVVDPAVACQDDCLRAGAIVEYRGQKLFVSVELSVRTDEDYLHLERFRAGVGAWRLPKKAITKHLTEASVLKALSDKRVANRFSYPHSDYDLRIDQITCRDGKLELTIVPITPE